MFWQYYRLQRRTSTFRNRNRAAGECKSARQYCEQGPFTAQLRGKKLQKSTWSNCSAHGLRQPRIRKRHATLQQLCSREAWRKDVCGCAHTRYKPRAVNGKSYVASTLDRRTHLYASPAPLQRTVLCTTQVLQTVHGVHRTQGSALLFHVFNWQSSRVLTFTHRKACTIADDVRVMHRSLKQIKTAKYSFASQAP